LISAMDKNQGTLLLAIGVVSFLLRLAFLHEPFERDEGLYAYIGQEVLRGSIPYKDAIEIKPPAIYYLYAAAIAIFGETTESIRIFTALYSLCSVYAVFLLTRRLSGSKAGLVAALLQGIFSSAPLLQGSSSNTEAFLVLPCILAVYFVLRAMEEGERRYIFLCGVFCGCAMLIKTVAIPTVLLAVGGVLSLTRPINTIREKALDLATFAFGPAIQATITIGYFFLNQALDDFLYWNVTFPLRYRSTSVSGPPFFWAAYMLLPVFLPLLVTALPTFVRLLFESPSRKNRVAALSLPAALLGVILPGKNFPHYFIPLVSPLAMLAGIEIIRFSKTPGWRLHIGRLLLVVIFGLPVYMQYKYYLIYTPDQVSVQKYGPLFVESLQVAHYIKERTLPSDYIFQWGLEMELYYLTSRRAPVPFTASVFVGWSKDAVAAVRQMMEGINQKKPKYIVFQNQWSNVPGVLELSEIIRRDYFLEATVAYAQIYRRR
jgi:4-amino-4-deoxy-L-arabinose transferase-like glycosyltransferase